MDSRGHDDRADFRIPGAVAATIFLKALRPEIDVRAGNGSLAGGVVWGYFYL